MTLKEFGGRRLPHHAFCDQTLLHASIQNAQICGWFLKPVKKVRGKWLRVPPA